jgi:hypothetical protein
VTEPDEGEVVELRAVLGPAAVWALRRVMAVTGWSDDEVVNRALPKLEDVCDRAEAYRIEARQHLRMTGQTGHRA